MNKHVIATSANGTEIYVNLIDSKAGHYLNRQPYVIKFIKEALSTIELKDQTVSLEHDMGRVIGSTDIIETTDKDTIIYAQPYKQNFFSRYAKNRSPLPSPKLTLMLNRDDSGNYELTDTWIGPCSPPFPGHKNENKISKNYWETHALVHNSQIVQSKTVTKICPY